MNMFEKTSSLEDKTEYQKIVKDYSNNYGVNIGSNNHIMKSTSDETMNVVNKKLKAKKR